MIPRNYKLGSKPSFLNSKWNSIGIGIDLLIFKILFFLLVHSILIRHEKKYAMQDDGFFNDHDVDDDVASIDSQINSMDDDDMMMMMMMMIKH